MGLTDRAGSPLWSHAAFKSVGVIEDKWPLPSRSESAIFSPMQRIEDFLWLAANQSTLSIGKHTHCPLSVPLLCLSGLYHGDDNLETWRARQTGGHRQERSDGEIWKVDERAGLSFNGFCEKKGREGAMTFCERVWAISHCRMLCCFSSLASVAPHTDSYRNRNRKCFHFTQWPFKITVRFATHREVGERAKRKEGRKSDERRCEGIFGSVHLYNKRELSGGI